MIRRRLYPHLPGLIYVGLLTLVGVAAMNNQNNLLFWVLGVMIAGLLISAFLTFYMLWSLKIRRIDPQHGSVGEPLIVRYAVFNRSRLLSIFNITIAEASASSGAGTWRHLMQPASAWIMHIGPRETVHGEAIFWPTKRGEVAFERLRVSTTFPFGIIRKSITVPQSQHTLIYPMLYELKRGVLDALTPAGLMGLKVTQHPGSGDDYFGVREFKPGDSMRHISWKRTAHADELITIERTSPSPAKMRVILDLTVPTEALRVEANSAISARDLEERAISLAASIMHAADLQGFEVGLTVQGVNVPPIAVRRNRWHLRKIMAALAGIGLDGPRSAAKAQPIRDAERAALVVIAPDRVQPMSGRDDAWYLTARQLDSLAERPIGWNAGSIGSGPTRMSAVAKAAGRQEAAA
jgi:uncharacterized protein (DUF58 family)